MVAAVRVFSGQRAWLVQRFSALAILGLLVLSIVTLLGADGSAFERWRAVATSTHGAVLLFVFFVAMGIHGWIGARDIVLDYVHAPALRVPLLAVIAIVLFAILIRVAMIIAGTP